jgi:hypothetical protein
VALAIAVTTWQLGAPPAHARTAPSTVSSTNFDSGIREDNAPLVAFLAPHDGRALNVPVLHVRALVAAFKPDRQKSFVFNGQLRPGRNAGRISHVDIALNNILVDRIDIEECRREVLVDSRIDVGQLPDGPHTLMVTAFQGNRRAEISRSASATVVLDRTLPQAERNLIEQAATPTPFACFSVNSEEDDEQEAGKGQDEDRVGPGPFELKGRLVLGRGGDGVDLSQDRVVIALGPHLTVLEAGMLLCETRGDDRRKCEFEDPSQPVVQKVELEQKNDGRWEFKIEGGPLSAEVDTFYLRIGNDWGGIDLRSGEVLVDLRLALDTSRQAQGLIGLGGGSVETTDAAGVRIRLDVPAGALTRDTLITVTPLLVAPLADPSTALHPGVKFEPEGLVFSQAATLTLDFSASGQVVTGDHVVFIYTSPLITFPLPREVDPAAQTLTARLRHFSTAGAGTPTGATIDPVWAAAALAATTPLTLSEIESLVVLAGLQQQLGCTANCIDLALLVKRVVAALGSLNASPLVQIVEIRSDQVPGRRANFLPGGSGADGLPYIMVGAREDGRLYVAATVQPLLPEVGLFPLAAGLRKTGESSVPAAPFTGNTLTISRELGITPRTVDYDVVVGVDTDQDGVLTGDEIVHSMGTVKAVSRVAFETARTTLAAISFPGSLVAPYAASILLGFLSNTSPVLLPLSEPPIAEATEQISFNQPLLSHNTGVLWDPNGTATIRQFIFDSQGFLSGQLLGSNAFANEVIVDTLQGHVLAIVQFFVANPSVTVHDFTFSAAKGVSFGPEFGLTGVSPFLGIAGSRFTGSVTPRVRRTGQSVFLESVQVAGKVKDLYDFQFELGSINALGAIVQAGFPTLGNGNHGQIFRTVVDIDGTRTDIPFDFCAAGAARLCANFTGSVTLAGQVTLLSHADFPLVHPSLFEDTRISAFVSVEVLVDSEGGVKATVRQATGTGTYIQGADLTGCGRPPETSSGNIVGATIGFDDVFFELSFDFAGTETSTTCTETLTSPFDSGGMAEGTLTGTPVFSNGSLIAIDFNRTTTRTTTQGSREKITTGRLVP